MPLAPGDHKASFPDSERNENNAPCSWKMRVFSSPVAKTIFTSDGAVACGENYALRVGLYMFCGGLLRYILSKQC